MRAGYFVVLLASMTALGSCSPGASGSNPAAQPQFEAAVIPGSAVSDDQFIKMNRTTGETWIHFAGRRDDRFYLVGEKLAPRAGDYRLVTWSTVDPKGTVTFNIYRFDVRSGHTWILKSQSPATNYWSDVNTPVSVF